MVFERRSRIASVYQVILTPCMSGRLIEVGKMVVGMFLVDIGFAIARVMIHWKTRWIMASETESIVLYRSP